MSKTYKLATSQIMPVSMEEAWDFFSSPANLQAITPPDMGFVIKSGLADKAYAGQIIEYSVKPVLGIPIYWMTEITQVKDKEYFIDEQRFGPYSLWHHQHHFKEVPGGVEMNDLVHYRLPFWILGDVANTLFVKKQLQGIFDYRTKAVEKKWGKM
jgi:ligand-binding SRPBCC domain-containing protein